MALILSYINYHFLFMLLYVLCMCTFADFITCFCLVGYPNKLNNVKICEDFNLNRHLYLIGHYLKNCQTSKSWKKDLTNWTTNLSIIFLQFIICPTETEEIFWNWSDEVYLPFCFSLTLHVLLAIATSHTLCSFRIWPSNIFWHKLQISFNIFCGI